MNKTRVVLVSDTLCDANGVSRFIQDVAKTALEKNYHFYAITATKKRYCQIGENFTILPPLVGFKMPFYPELDLVIPPFLTLYREIKRLKPDIIHVSTPGFVGFGARMIAKILKIPLMGTYHTDFPSYIFCNTRSQTLKKITQWYERTFYRGFLGLFIRSEDYRSVVRGHLGFADEAIFTIPAGIDISRFDRNLREASIWEPYQIPQDAKKALYVGRMTKEKNIPFLLEMWCELHEEGSSAWLILVGSGAYEEKKREYEKKNIRFLGHQEGATLAALYASSDFFLFPSTTDTLGQVVIEALSSALPVVVSDQGGPKSLVGHAYNNGFVIATEDKTLWKETVMKLILDEDLLKNLSENAHESAKALRFEKSFDFFWQVHCDKSLLHKGGFCSSSRRN